MSRGMGDNNVPFCTYPVDERCSMTGQDQGKKGQSEEIAALKRRIRELEKADADRRQAEKALRESEKKYRLLADNSTDVIWVMTPEGRFTYVSPSVTTLSGYTPEEVLEIPFEQYVVESFVEPVMTELAAQLGKPLSERAQSMQLEMQQYCKDRSVKDIEITVSWLLDEHGAPIGLQGSTRDITARKKAEEHVRILADLFDISPLSIAVHDLDGNFIYANRQLLDLHGYSREEFFTLNVRKLDSPASAALVEERIREAMKTGEVKFEVEHIRKDGTSFPMEVVAKPAKWGGKDVLLSVAADITERKRALAALWESEEKHRLLIENSHDIIYTLTPEGVFTYVSPSWTALLGHPADQVIGKPFLPFIHPDDLDVCLEALQKAIEKEERVTGVEYRIRHIDGSWRWHTTNGVPLKDASGKVVAFEGSCSDITERKMAQEALRESEEQYRLVVENADEAISIAQDGRHKFLNRRALEIIGRPREEILETPFLDYVHPDDREMIAERYRKRLRHEHVPNVYTFRLLAGDGTVKWIEIHVTPISWQGKPATLNFFSDITERKQAEEALRDSEIRYKAIFETTGTIMLIVEEDMTISLANHGFKTLTGYSREEVEGKRKWTEFVEKEDLEIMIARHHLRRTGTDAVDNSYEFRLRHRDGSMKNILLTVSLIPGTKRSVASLIDITERKRAEEEAKENHLCLLSVLGAMTDPVYVADPETYEVLFVNRALEEAIGIPEHRKCYEYLQQRSDPCPFCTNDRILGENFGKTYVWEYRNESNNHLYRCVDRAIRWPDGRIVRYEMAFDITEQRNAEEERRRLEERLQHANKMDAIGTLAGGIAHDFNNLLMGIQGYASLTLLDLDPSHPHYERLKRIEEQVQSGTDLTRQLLGFARGGRYEVKPTDMSEIVKKTSSMFGRTKKEISIHRKYAKSLWSVEVDRGQMEQIFMNLYVNAWQAMPGGGDIYLETENVYLDAAEAFSLSIRPGKYVKITITDTGAGMDEKTKERIFDPFFTTKAMGRGTGLGLAMVYGIVKGHEGMIHVESEPGHGSTFEIFLPASEKEVLKERKEAGAIAKGSETILLVDDEQMVAEVTGELLSSLGYRVYLAGSGQEAIAVYRTKRNEIDLVILDMIMPGLSGGETFDRLREIDPGVKVLLSSGYSIDGEAKTIMDRGCNGFLQKPFHIEQLSSKLREVLR